MLDVVKKEGNWYLVGLPADEKGIIVTGYIHQSIVEAFEETKQPVELKKEAREKKEDVIVKKEKPLKVEFSKVEFSYPVKKTPASQRKVAFKIGGGINAPFGDYDIGFSVNGSIIYPVSPVIDLIGGVEFSSSTGKGAKYEYEHYEWEADFSFSRIIFFGDARYTFKGEIDFFAEGGLGIYSDKEKIEAERELWLFGLNIITLSISDSRTNLGIRIGGGIVFSNIEVMVMSHMVEDSNMFTLLASFRF